MAFKGLRQRQVVAKGAGWVFNPPPGWPAPPPGWQPPDGWLPDPSWPPAPSGWEFWKPEPQIEPQQPQQSFVPAGEMRLTCDGQPYAFPPGSVVRIGRASDNDVVVTNPAVSRKHAQLSWAHDGWIFENVGQAPTYQGGQSVTRVSVGQALELTLGSAHGPVLRIEPSLAPASPPPMSDAPPFLAGGMPGPEAAPGPGAAFGPGLAGPGLAGPGLAGPGPVGPGQAGPGRAGAGAAFAPGAAGPGPGPGVPGQFGPGGPNVPAVPPASAGDELVQAFRILIPVGSWLKNPGWRQGLRLLVIAYALLPLIFIALLSSSTDLSTPGWAYGLYVAPLWVIGFYLLIRPGPVRRLEIQVAIGVIIWTLVWINIVTININDHLVTNARRFSFAAALGVGYNEEITKALPILLAGLILLKARRTKLDARMWMFLGTIAGLTFGVAEAALYTSRDLVLISQAQANSQAVGAVLAFAERVFVDGFQHAVWAGISGFFIGMAINYRRRRIPLIILGVTIPAFLHALNDWSVVTFNSYWVWILIQAFSLLLFLGYTMSAGTIERQVRQTPMFRGESMIMERLAEQKEA
jgi:RsiW-degrading membrane proteinase PrsW (M82 family)